jgi:hypothetical protein
VRSFGPDGARPSSSIAGSGLFRPEVVLSWIAGSHPITGERSRVSGPFSCPEWPVNGHGQFSARELKAAIFRTWTLFFGCDRISRRPLRGRPSYFLQGG